MSTIEAPLQAIREFEAARARGKVKDLLRSLVKTRISLLEQGLGLHDAITAFEAKVLEGISRAELSIEEFEVHYKSVCESWDRWIQEVHSEVNQEFEIPELAKSDVAVRVSQLLEEAVARKENRDRRQASMDASIARAPLPEQWSEPGFASVVPGQTAIDLRDYVANLQR